MKDIQKEKNSLIGKTVVITGASSGVGLATAEAFVNEGCNVILLARGQKGLDEAAENCKRPNVKVIAISTDTSNADDVEKAALEALSINGKVDIWVNNAGVMASGKFEEIPMEIHQQVIKTNLFGYMHGAYNAIKIFKEQNEGILINNVSIGGFMPAPYSAVYSATKYGIRGMMECLQGEISNHKHIHICNVYPQLQNSTGNLHSAKYSGFDITIPFIASDPRDTAAAIVNLAKNPKKDHFPDLKSAAITRTYKTFPKTVINTASAALRMKMKLNHNKENNPGNVLENSQEPLRVYGNPNLNKNSPVTTALIAGVAISTALFFLNKKF
ncbi:SDR family NAD(P)-dependent oxidoreductase [Flavobacterium ustbae]|uniref:SDR family NAD(P)-dependent oxidoreductase n=1 Tax=Flavobacterium ustbae TaxID=2488790 RepID=UPI000F76BADF|nr:SDR family NAD(P)-dependent oxidoreductase [Flavobacterium ustbae]